MAEDSPAPETPEQTTSAPPLPPQGDSVAGGSAAEASTFADEDTPPAAADQPTEDTNPKSPRVDGINYVHDEAKAEFMAHAEDEFASKGVASRKLRAPSQELVEKAAELVHLDTELEKDPRQFSTIQRMRMKHRRANVGEAVLDHFDEDVRQESQAQQMFTHDFSRDRHPDGPLAYEERRTNPAARAQYYDRQAARIGDWAGLLHDHPLSEEFLEVHSELQTDPGELPKRLVRLEDNAAALKRIIAREERASRVTMRAELAAMLRNTGLSPHVEEFNELLGYATPEEQEEYMSHVRTMHGSAKALDGLHDRLYDRLETDALRQQVKLIDDILDDVRRAIGLPVEDHDDASVTSGDVPDEVAVEEDQSPSSPPHTSEAPDVTE